MVLATTYSIGQWRVDAGASLLQYQSLHAFNQNAYYLGGGLGGFRTDKWYFELGPPAHRPRWAATCTSGNVAAGGQATRMFLGGGRLRAQVRGTSVQGQAH